MTAEGNGKKTLFVDADEFNCSVALATLAVELAGLYGLYARNEPAKLLNEAMDLICEARNVIDERSL